VAQVVAYTLKIPLEKVAIKPSNSVVAANSQVTGGSLGSEAVAFVCKFFEVCNVFQTNCIFFLGRNESLREVAGAFRASKSQHG
jgi:hypothetical protein